MAIVTTYVCDITGKQGSKEEFVEVGITVGEFGQHSGSSYVATSTVVKKLVAKEVALKLNLIKPKGTEEAQPEVTFESKLTTLLKDYINDIVYDEVSDQISHRS